MVRPLRSNGKCCEGVGGEGDKDYLGLGLCIGLGLGLGYFVRVTKLTPNP